MKISQLQAAIARLEKELEEVRQELAHDTHDPATLSTELIQSRAYAFDPKTLSAEEVVKGCVGSLGRYGFCVIDNLIPTEKVPVIRQEILEAQKTVRKNL